MMSHGETPTDKESEGADVSGLTGESYRKSDELVSCIERSHGKLITLEYQLKQDILAVRQQRDVNDLLEAAVKSLPDRYFPNKLWDAQMGSIAALETAADNFGRGLIQGVSFIATGAGNTSAASVTLSTLRANAELPSHLAVTVIRSSEKLHRLFDLKGLIDTIQSEFARLKFPGPKAGTKTPAEHLVDAQAALDVPSGKESTEVSVFISLRSCIDDTIDELFQRRPHKPAIKVVGPKRPGKVSLIGEECARPDLPPEHFSGIGDRLETICGELTDGKSNKLARPEQVDLFHRGLLALSALLKSIDQTRLVMRTKQIS